MTPEEAPKKARELLNGTDPGPWEWRWDAGLISLFDAKGESVATDLEVQNSDLAAAAPTLARMIAGMREEWRVEFQAVDDKKWYPLTDWASGEPDRRPWNVTPTRLVRRYVTPTEEIK